MAARERVLALAGWQLEAVARFLERRAGGRAGAGPPLLSARRLPAVLAGAWRADHEALVAENARLRGRTPDPDRPPEHPDDDWWHGVGEPAPMEAAEGTGWWGGAADDDLEDEREAATPVTRPRPVLVK